MRQTFLRSPFLETGHDWAANGPAWEENPALAEEVIGDDQRSPVANAFEVPYRWICEIKIDVDKRTGTTAYGTGLLMGERYVLTAGHNLGKGTDSYDAKQVTVYPARNGSDEPFGAYEVDRYFRQGNSGANDYALLELRGVPALRTNRGLQLGWAGLDAWSGAASLYPLSPATWNRVYGQKALVAGYSGDLNGALQGRFDHKMFRDTGTVSAHRLPGLLKHQADTYPGASGSPVWLKRRHTWWLIGIHVNEGTQSVDSRTGVTRYLDNLAVRYTPAVSAQVRKWMGLSPLEPVNL